MKDSDIIRIVRKFFDEQKIDVHNKIHNLQVHVRNSKNKSIVRGIAMYDGLKIMGYAVPISEHSCAYYSKDCVTVLKK